MKKKKKAKNGDGFAGDFASAWFYSPIVKSHFFRPQNFLINEKGYKADVVGMAGSALCGDLMKIWLKIEPKSRRIKECKWKTFGCASAIAATSMMSVMVTEKGGMKISEAFNLKPQQIIKRLGGLPNRKFHCSVLGEEALKDAIQKYWGKKTINYERSKSTYKNDRFYKG